MASPAAKPRPPPASLAGPPGSAAGCWGEAGPARGGPREPHVRAHRRGTGQPRKPSVATRWTEPGGGRSTPCAEGCSAGGRPSPFPSFPCFWGRVTDPAAPGGGSGGLATGGPRSRAETALDCVASGKPCPSLGLGEERPGLGAGPAERVPVLLGAGWIENRYGVATLHALVSLSAENRCCTVYTSYCWVLHVTDGEIEDQG